MRILHFHRKPHPFHFSIEQLFEAIRAQMPEEMDVQVAECPYPSQGLLPRLKNLWFARRLRGDVFHITGDVHYLALATPRDRTVLTIHDLGFLRQPNPVLRKLLFWFWLKIPVARARVVTTISEASRQDILAYLPDCPPEKIRVIPNPVLPFFRPVERVFDGACPTVLLIGTKPNKNVARQLEALSGIRCRVRIIGERKPEIERLLQGLGLPYTWQERLSQEELLQAYAASDLLLFASTLEGFGMPILEAQAVGRPVVTSNCSSMPEVAGAGACLVDPLDVASIRQGVLRVIRDGAYREELLRLGRENVERFGAREVARRYAEVYAEVYAEAHSPPAPLSPERGAFWAWRKGGRGRAILLLLSILFLLLFLHRVPRRITAEDRIYLDRFLQGVPASEAANYEEQIAHISDIQQAVLGHASPGEGIPEGHRREPRQLWEHGQGACYDISRTLEKALRYRGYRVRHAALFEKLLKPGSRSHAATEVRTQRGWLVVENTAPWLALDAGGNPWSFRQPFPASWQSPPPAAVMEFYTRKHTVVYGLYSRHGRFYPPYSPIPDF